ncbi:DHA2 family efflux MFS transporter permease subunit [Conexibacter sp. SYSU D00693]|uniref:DHA2 family efflux MFS transporter permease subunit n=1 Tax=Conexibacter sp. SYSU D00693 TaxID=2812560 RepID=UPI00196AE423|nr:DHA2 family efflux MFS transporter permease subunit [Conexibacter sp. SYSU D00693]
MSTAVPASTSPRALLALLLLGQFLVVLDVSVVNVALPDMQSGLGLSATGLQWVINGYTIAYAGFLLLGGRLGDVLGQRRAFLAGLGLFVVGSLVGGLAESSGVLLVGRVVQGLGAAVLSPATLTILLGAFPEGPERAKAMGWWMAIGAAGGATGGLVGGALTEWLSWRWVLLVNVPVGAAVLVLAARMLRDGVVVRRPRLDVPGAVAATTGLAALVLGITQIEAHGWTATEVVVPVAAAVVLLGAFVQLQRITAEPLMPLPVLRLPGLAVANLVTLVSGAGLFAVWFFLTLYMQEVLGLGPLEAGVGFLPHTLAIIAGTQITTRWLGARDPRVVVSLALAMAAVGFLLLARAEADGSYVTDVALPGALVMLGAGISFPPIIGAATAGVGPEVHGLASGILNTARMVGGGLGLAILATVATSTTRDAADGAPPDPAALVAGFDDAYLVAAATIAVAALLSWLLPPPDRPAGRVPQPAPAEA